jgi:hypothetical protein
MSEPFIGGWLVICRGGHRYLHMAISRRAMKGSLVVAYHDLGCQAFDRRCRASESMHAVNGIV